MSTEREKTAAGGGLAAARCSAPWQMIDEDSWVAVHDEGDFTGAVVTEICVHKGGNGRWSIYGERRAKGRFRKSPGGGVCNTRIRSQHIAGWFPGQVMALREAFARAEEQWAKWVPNAKLTERHETNQD